MGKTILYVHKHGREKLVGQIHAHFTFIFQLGVCAMSRHAPDISWKNKCTQHKIMAPLKQMPKHWAIEG